SFCTFPRLLPLYCAFCLLYPLFPPPLLCRFPSRPPPRPPFTLIGCTLKIRTGTFFLSFVNNLSAAETTVTESCSSNRFFAVSLNPFKSPDSIADAIFCAVHCCCQR